MPQLQQPFPYAWDKNALVMFSSTEALAISLEGGDTMWNKIFVGNFGLLPIRLPNEPEQKDFMVATVQNYFFETGVNGLSQ